MTVQTIGAGLDYENVAAWAVDVKADSPLTHSWEGEMQDNGANAYGDINDLNFSAVTLNGFTISLSATTNKHTGDFGSGTYIEGNKSFDALYDFENITVNDLEFRNTSTNNFATAGKGFGQTGDTANRCLFTSAGIGTVGAGVNPNNGIFIACRFEGTGSTSSGFVAPSNFTGTLKNCSFFGVTNGLLINSQANGTIQNCVAYGAATADFSFGTNNWTTETNNASDDGTHPGTAGVTISGDPFDPDGYTPAASGQLDGAGVDLSITLDAANNAFAVPPSIGAYEVIGVGPTVPVLSNPTTPVYTP